MEVCARVGLVGSPASYDQLVRQVEDLKKENSHLRRELQDNSSQLSRLEHDTSDMKEVLKHLQDKLEQDTGSSGSHCDVLDQTKGDVHVLYNQYASSGPPDASVIRSRSCMAPPVQPDTPQKKGKVESRSNGALRAELEKERSLLLVEIDKEEKEKLWYFSQLQSLSKRLEELPQVETFSLQIDLIRQQLEFESQHLRCVLEERFGTADEMVQRAQIRASRLEQIEEQLEDMPQTESREQVIQPCTNLALADKIPENLSQLEDNSGQTESKVEVVFWLLSMLATRDKDDMSRTLLAMSSSQDSCQAMRRSGCLPLLLQILHDSERDGRTQEFQNFKDARMRANAALHNVIFSQPDEGQAKKEMRVLHILEQIRSYTETCWDWMLSHEKKDGAHDSSPAPVPVEPQICQASCAIMKLSFDEEYRRAMNELGGLQAIAELLEVDYQMHRMTSDPLSLALRRYAGMALTNLTFGDVVNKATLCSRRGCMQAIVAHLASESEELQQVASSILRNLSWRADMNSKKNLREVGSVISLMQCALRANKESTLKSVLSALWNLSAHSTENKASVCLVEGSLGFLVSTLTYKCQSNSLSIIESGGGILRNVSSLIATRDDYRQILRDHNCLQTLLQHLKSHSLTIVSNACGTLWNLSARCPQDQELLWDLGAVSMLRNLIHSKHKMIAMGSAAALRNLLAHRPPKYKDASVVSPGSCMPSLYMRKQKALEAELDAKHLAETFDSMDKQGLKPQAIKGPLRHIESLVKDYASDSGCFDDDEIPNTSISAETGNSSMLSMYLNSSFTQGQIVPRTGSLRKGLDPEKGDCNKQDLKKLQDDTSVADKLVSCTQAKIERLVEDISTMHTSSDDSFSLSSEDHCVDWAYGSDELHEGRAQSCSPCRFSDNTGLARRENLSRAQALLRLKTAYTSLSNDSLNSGSTSDGYCPKEHMKPCSRTAFMDCKEELQRYQKRPSRLDLKNVLCIKPEKNHSMDSQVVHEKNTDEQRELNDSRKRHIPTPRLKSMDSIEHKEEPTIDDSNKLPTESSVHTIKLSPSYKHISGLDSLPKNVTGFPGNILHQTLSAKKTAWLLPSQPSDTISKALEKASAHSSSTGEQESLQKYAVEGTPICFSRCSSLSSLSSGDNLLDGPSRSENEIDSDSSLEILEVEAGQMDYEKGPQGRQKMMDQNEGFLSSSHPIAVPLTKPEKHFLRDLSPSRNEDATPSSSSENYIQETPLVMSRCSSVSSLGSFESPSIASSIQSDPCSEMISGTISPSELPDSPGQTMPPSRSKTPNFDPLNHLEKEASQFNIQWENNVKKFMEITDFKERFQIPRDIDSMIYFTVEKPTENFSCASSLSDLPLHEHYIQKDVELKLIPPLPEKNNLNFVAHEKHGENREERILGFMKKSEIDLVSDDDIDILKECIHSAMPPKLHKMKTSVLSGRLVNAKTNKTVQLPVYMLVPAHTQMAGNKNFSSKKDFLNDDSSFTDSAEGTPVNFSSTASLSDETLQFSLKESQELRHRPSSRMDMRDFGAILNSHHHHHHQREERMMFSNEHNAGLSKTNSKASRALSAAYILKEHKKLDGKRSIQACHKNVSNFTGSEERVPCLGGHAKLDIKQEENDHRNFAFQSFCHTTPTEEAVYCFFEDDVNLVNSSKESPRRKNEPSKSPRKQCQYSGTTNREAKELKHVSKGNMSIAKFSNFIEDEPMPCYSLSSSMSSLSDIEPVSCQSKLDTSNKHPTRPQAWACINLPLKRDSSASHTSDEEKCISVLPRRRKLSSRKRKHKLKNHENKGGVKHTTAEDKKQDSSDMSDLDNADWEAIKEGANSIVRWIHQATASISRESSTISRGQSSDSLISSPSVSARRSLYGQYKQNRDRSLSSKTTGSSQRSSSSDGLTNNKGKQVVNASQKQTSNIPMVFRGRTVIYMPAQEKSVAGKQSYPNNEPQEVTKFPNSMRSRSLHRLGKSADLGGEMTLPKRSATPPARINSAPPCNSTRNSTPTRKAQSPVNTPSPKSKGVRNSQTPGNKTQKSPVRIPYMRKPSPRNPPGTSPLALESITVSPRQSPSKRPIAQNNRLNQVRNDTEKSGIFRQLTFIKETSGGIRRQHSDVSTSQRQHRAPPQSNGALNAVFLCSSRCEELKVHKGPKPKSPSSPNHPPRRTSSESPSRLPVRNMPPPPEPFKRYSSSPHINLPWSRVEGKSGHNISKNEDKRVPRIDASPGSRRATWRRIRDEDIPHILRSTLPACALPLTEEPSEPQRKTSDAVVQTEDIAIAKMNSSTSPTIESRNRHSMNLTVMPELAKGTPPVVNLPTSRHSSPSRAARVTPFNYVPSPIVTVTEEAAGKITTETIE
ncbi:adenomatous polyposis coli protein 2 [Hyperolius riggenbachi]|uniref:adenomatous polyposis coli protein 2 n=1 Tax=Hyperolius riggenbachi TaxID=752182 RepID=UPI0035A3AC6A